MMTTLKYVGVSVEDLIDTYILFVRSVIEYCSVVFHSRLTVQQSEMLERVQKTCLKVILGDMYINYSSALEMCGLTTLNSRREKRCLDFSIKCLKHPRNKKLFPLNTRKHDLHAKTKEMFHVNNARTTSYRQSAIPYCQRILNVKYS